jgi:hypothetical protein
VITPGQAHDITAVTALMHDIDCDPEQMLGDRATIAKPFARTSRSAVVRP